MCPACASTAHGHLFSKDGYRYVACASCGSARLDPIPEFDGAELYGPDYFTGGTVPGGYADYEVDERLHRANAHDRLNRLRRVGARPPGTILELGAGYGYFLDEARHEGWTVTGSDVSPHARSRAASLGIDLAPGIAGTVGPADVLAAFQVIEHMPDPFAELRQGVDALTSGGVVIVEGWDRSHWIPRCFGRRWQLVTPPAVIHMFTKDGLRTMAERLGLTDLEVDGSAKYVSLGAVAGQLAIDRPRVDALVKPIRRSRAGRRPIKYGFGDLVTLTANKP